MRAAFALIALLAAPAAFAAEAPYAPLAFLAGHCWKGRFGEGPRTDEHCFEWVYGGRFLRDRHVVRDDAREVFSGETIYFWNSAAQRIEYVYIEDRGGFSRGGVAVEADAVVFPDAEFVDGGKTQVYRSRWTRHGDDGYDVATEFKGDASWTPGFALEMRRSDR